MANESAKMQWTAADGSATKPAVSHRPADGCDPESKKPEVPPRHVPIGLPISPEDYERLKSGARYETPAASTGGQQDPATTDEREE